MKVNNNSPLVYTVTQYNLYIVVNNVNSKDVGDLVQLVNSLKGKNIPTKVIEYRETAKVLCTTTTNSKVLEDTIKGIKIEENVKYNGYMDAIDIIQQSNVTPIIIHYGSRPFTHTDFNGFTIPPIVYNNNDHSTVTNNQDHPLKILSIIDVNQLNNHLNQIIGKDPDLKISFYSGHTELMYSTDDTVIRYEIEANNKIDSIPKGTSIRFLDSQYYDGARVDLQDTVYKGTKWIDSVKLSSKLTEDSETFTTAPIVTCMIDISASPSSSNNNNNNNNNNNPIKTYQCNIHLLFGWMAKDFTFPLRPNQGNPYLNWMVYGRMGAGKSSLINGATSMLSETQNVKRPLSASSSGTHVTQHFSSCNIGQLFNGNTQESHLHQELIDKLHINIWDVWGFECNTNYSFPISYFIQGKVRNDQGIIRTISMSTTASYPENRIHGVVFVVPIGAAESEVELEETNTHIQIAKTANIHPILVINHVKDLNSHFEVEERIAKLVSVFEMDRDLDVFVFDNYEGERYRDIDKDLQYWRLLKRLFEVSMVVYTNQYPQEQYNDMDTSGDNEQYEYQHHQETEDLHQFSSMELDDDDEDSNTNTTAPLQTGLICITNTCVMFNRVIGTNFCGECGVATVLPLERSCNTVDCKNRYNAVKSKLCSDCNCIAEPLYCKATDCVKYDKNIGTPFCPLCGARPSTLSNILSAQDPIVHPPDAEANEDMYDFEQTDSNPPSYQYLSNLGQYISGAFQFLNTLKKGNNNNY